jgi:hypothetical protein
MVSITILSIIDSSLKLALEIVKGIPEAERNAFWQRHNARMEWLEGLFRKHESDQ